MERKSNSSGSALAHVDLKSKKIMGVKKGTWKYYHEEGHIKFSENPRTSNLQLLNEYLIKIWFLSIMFAIHNKLFLSVSVVLWLTFTLIELYEEWWCNQYANRKVYKP